ncbi:MAG: WxcM-like domain-containing protein [Candidatus Omnitrophota bacterium]|mgnify:CR=1 FL=1|nr:MAG: WxcM-like domain-containing protein [Candidatus Omnitrophota bacterium]
MNIRLEKVRWVKLPSVKDSRGTLTSIESNIDTPFLVKRIFYMHHIVSDRGGHAHIDTDQVIIAVYGKFKVGLSNGVEKKRYVMEDPAKGLYVPRMIFISLYGFSKGAVCMVLASTHYDIKKSIRSWQDYLEFIKRGK